MATSKQTADFQPSRPKAPRDPAPAIARISTPTSTGAMIDRIRRRNRSLTNSMRSAQSGCRQTEAEAQCHRDQDPRGERESWDAQHCGSRAFQRISSCSRPLPNPSTCDRDPDPSRDPVGTLSQGSRFPTLTWPSSRGLPSSSHGSVPVPRTGGARTDAGLPSGFAATPRCMRCGTCPAPGITSLGFGSAPRSA